MQKRVDGIFFKNSEKKKKEVLLMFQGVFIESNNPFIPVCQAEICTALVGTRSIGERDSEL